MLVSLLPSDYPACTSLLDLNRPHQNSWFPCLSPMVNTLKDGSCCCRPRTGWVSGLMRFTHVRHPLHIQCWPPWAIPALTTSSPIPWWSTHWESACQCKGHEFNPWSGKFPHARTKPHVPQLLSQCSRAHGPQLLSPCAATTEANAPTACVLQQEKHCNKPVHCNEE